MAVYLSRLAGGNGSQFLAMMKVTVKVGIKSYLA